MTSTELANQGVSWEVEVRFSHQQRPWVFGKGWQEATGLRHFGTNKIYLEFCQRSVNLSQGGSLSAEAWRYPERLCANLTSQLGVCFQTYASHNSFHFLMFPVLQAPCFKLCLISFGGPVFIDRTGINLLCLQQENYPRSQYVTVYLNSRSTSWPHLYDKHWWCTHWASLQ